MNLNGMLFSFIRRWGISIERNSASNIRASQHRTFLIAPSRAQALNLERFGCADIPCTLGGRNVNSCHTDVPCFGEIFGL